MKKNTICILIVATALAGAQSAQAGKKERYLIGGLLGGWILNNVASDSIHTRVRHYPSVEVHSRARSCSPVAVDRHHYSRPSGRYEYRRVKEWDSGHYDRVRTRCGRIERRWVPGRYTYRTKKVWVSYGSSHSRSYGRSRHTRH